MTHTGPGTLPGTSSPLWLLILFPPPLTASVPELLIPSTLGLVIFIVPHFQTYWSSFHLPQSLSKHPSLFYVSVSTEHWALQTLVIIAFKGACWLFAKQPLTCPNLSASPSASRASMETSARLPKAAGSFWYGNSVCASLAQTRAPLLPLPFGLNRFRCSLMKEECGLTFSFFSVDRSQGEEKV